MNKMDHPGEHRNNVAKAIADRAVATLFKAIEKQGQDSVIPF
jgi:hypothetical protein